MEKGQWRYVFLALNLIAMQMMGNLPYLFPVTTLTIFVYIVLFCGCNVRSVYTQIKKIPINIFSFISIGAGLIPLVLIYNFFSTGTETIFNHNLGRNLDGTTNLEGFLGYGGGFDLGMWKEFFFSVSPGMDRTFYIGLLPLPFIVLGVLLNRDRKQLHLVLLIIFLAVFSFGNWLAAFFYYTWPMMKFFRHLALTSIMMKPFLCLLAGFGFECLCVKYVDNKNIKKGVYCIFGLVALGLLALSLSHFYYSKNYGSAMELIQSYNKVFGRGYYEAQSSLLAQRSSLEMIFSKGLLSYQFAKTAMITLVMSLWIGIFLFVPKHLKSPVLCLGLLLHLFDVYGYKVFETHLRTTQLKKGGYSQTAFKPMPYAQKRDLFFWDNNPRAVELRSILPFRGVMHWTLHSYLFKDQVSNPFRTDHWLEPLYDLRQSYLVQLKNKLNPDDQKAFERLAAKGAIAYFPFIRRSSWIQVMKYFPAAEKISGISVDKIQFFSGAFLVEEQQLRSLITREEFRGDVLFVSLPSGKQIENVNLIKTPPSLSKNMRIQAPYAIEQFDANHLKIHVDLPRHQSAWVLYSDVWHPFWKAEVNGKEVPVFKADLAYKAIPLQQGKNTIHLSFGSNSIFVQQKIMGLNALFWLIIILYLSLRMVKGVPISSWVVSISVILILAIAVQYHPETTVNKRNNLIGYLDDYHNARVPINKDKLLEAIDYYQGINKSIAHKALSFSNLGLIYFYLGEYKKSIEAYKQAIKADPTLYTPYYDLGNIFYRLGNFKQAGPFLKASSDIIIKTRMSFFQLHNFFRSSRIHDMEENLSLLTKRMELDYHKGFLLMVDIEAKVKNGQEGWKDKKKLKDPLDLHFYGSDLKQFFIRYSLKGMNLYDKTATDHNAIFMY